MSNHPPIASFSEYRAGSTEEGMSEEQAHSAATALTAISIETGEEVRAKVRYDTRSGEAYLIRQKKVPVIGWQDDIIGDTYTDKQGNFTSYGNRHLDETTKEAWLLRARLDIKDMYDKAGGNANNRTLPVWYHTKSEIPSVDSGDEGEGPNDKIESSTKPPGVDLYEIENNFKGLQKTDSILQRLSLKNLKYPIDADYGNTQDYIQINQFTYQAVNPSVLFPRLADGSIPKRDDATGEYPKGRSPFDAAKSGASDIFLKGLKLNTPKEIPVGLVKLPMPNQLNDSNNVAWGEDQLNALTAAAATLTSGGVQQGIDFAQNIADGMGPIEAITNMFSGAKGAAAGLVEFLKKAKNDPNANLNARSVIGSSLLNLAGFGVSPEAILARGAGVIPNSNLALLFNAPALRAFRFDWKMSPRSQEEAIRINNIIRFFKQGMAAKKMQESGGRSYFLGTPNVFDIAFKTSKTNREITNTNHSVLRIKTCACVGAAVNYTPQGMWNAYEKGQPTSCILSLQFKELEPIFNTDYEEDPFEYDNLAGFVPSDAVGY